MKIFYFVFLLFPMLLIAQEEEEMYPYIVIREKPMFPMCVGKPQEEQLQCFKQALDAHIKKYFYYPPEAKEAGIQGRVNVSFCIDKEGKVKVLAVRGNDECLEEAAKYMIEQLPILIPGKSDGEPKIVTFAYPIIFKLQEDNTYVGLKDVEKCPQFEGCEYVSREKDFQCFIEHFNQYLKSKGLIPFDGNRDFEEGKVFVGVQIDEKGQTQLFSTNGKTKELEQRATELLEAMPAVKPAIYKGEPRAVRFYYSVKFK